MFSRGILYKVYIIKWLDIIDSFPSCISNILPEEEKDKSFQFNIFKNELNIKFITIANSRKKIFSIKFLV